MMTAYHMRDQPDAGKLFLIASFENLVPLPVAAYVGCIAVLLLVIVTR